MQKLPEIFDGQREQKAFQFQQLIRHGKTAIFQKTYKSSPKGPKFFEVVVIRIVPKATFPDGRVVEAHEAMPKPENWGVGGWSYATLVDAQTRFEKVL